MGIWLLRQRQSGPAMQANPPSAGCRAQVCRPEVVAAREEAARATWAEPGTHIPNLTRSATQGLKKWHFFLSHTQQNGDAKALALELFFGFKDLDKKTWLDVKMPKMDMEAMEDGVNGSKCVIAIITGGDNKVSRYFQRSMCVQELKWAIEAGVKIVPVVTAADKPNIGDYVAEGKAAGIDLSACDFKHVDRSNPEMMEASLKSIIGAEAIAEAGKTANVHLHCITIGTVSAVLSTTCTCARTCIQAHASHVACRDRQSQGRRRLGQRGQQRAGSRRATRVAQAHGAPCRRRRVVRGAWRRERG